MLTKEIKQRIDRARDILVGQLPLPSDQIELITIAMIYKFMDDMDEDARSVGGVPAFFVDDLQPFAWPALLSNQLGSADRVLRFTQAIEHLQKAQHIPALFRSIFQNTFLKFRDGRILKMFLDEINGFTYDNSEDLGNAFEYLLMSMGTQAENGQFRTPRHLIDFVVEVVEPELTDSILDPACGTAGFLISAFQYLMRLHTRGLEDYRVSLGNRTDAELARVKRGDKLRPEDRNKKGLNPVGYDITPMMVRLSRVNLYLHRVANPQIHEYDTLSNDNRWNDKFDCILANPPFMTPTGGVQPHSRFRLKANKAEVLFADYILEHLDPYRGKAGIIVPEGIIFQNSRDYVQLRRWLVEEAGLWAVVSLPAHVFQPYSGVKTSILLIDKELTRTGSPTAERTPAGANILLVKIDNDGYSLNTNRTPIAANDLPAAYQLLHAWKHDQPLPADAGVAHRVVARADFARLDPYRAATTALDAVRKPFRTLIKPGSEATRQRRIAAFCESVGLDHLPASEADLKAWFDEHLRATAVAYGAGDEAAELPDELKTTLREAREYSLGFERYAADVIPQSSHHDIVPLGEVFREVSDLWEPTNSNELVTYVGLENIESNTGKLVGNVQAVASSIKSAKKRFVSGDILYGRLRPVLNKVYSADHSGICSTDIIVLRPRTNDVAPTFFHTYFLTKLFNQEVLTGVAGAQLPRVSYTHLSSIKIPHPSLAVQQQLVTQIEAYQKVINGCSAVIEGYKASFPVKENWHLAKVGEVAEMEYGYTTSGLEAGPYRYIRITDIALDGTLLPTDAKYVSHEPGIEQYLTKVGDLLIARTGASFGKCLLITTNEPAIYASYLIRIRLSAEVLPEYFWLFTQSESYWEQANKLASGAAQPQFNANAIKQLVIPVPSLQEQVEIIAELQEEIAAVKSCRQLRTKMQARIQRVLGQVWQQEALAPAEADVVYARIS